MRRVWSDEMIDFLRDNYLKYSHEALAEHLKLTVSAVKHKLSRLKLKKRTPLSKEELIELFVNQRLSTAKIAKEHRLHQTTIAVRIKKFNIKRSRGNRCKLPEGMTKPSKGALEELRCDGLIPTQIARLFKVSRKVVFNWFKEYKLPILKETRSTPEVLMTNLLEKAGLTNGLKEQFNLILNNFRTKPDFAYPEHKIAIYCDGEYWHGGLRYINQSFEKMKDGPRKEGIRRTMKKDAKQHDILWTNGWTPLRFWQHDIEQKPDWVIEQIKKHLFDTDFIQKREEQRKQLIIEKEKC